MKSMVSVAYERGEDTTVHRPVMLGEVLDLMDIRQGGTYIDATIGGGGHAEAILDCIGSSGRLIGIDRDREALARAADRLSPRHANYSLEHGNFSEIGDIARTRRAENVDGVLMDLGMSSPQVDAVERGFSFMRDGPLDMRMDLSQDLTAADLVNDESVDALASILRTLGEEPSARRVARAIDQARRAARIETTGQLADIVSRAKGGRRSRIHPATKTFQALRMAVNRELESVEKGLHAAIRLVRPGGRVAVLTFHSLEDRLVKRCFASHAGRRESLPEGGERWVGEEPAVRRITRKPLRPSADEVRENPRSRSAKLRVVQRV